MFDSKPQETPEPSGQEIKPEDLLSQIKNDQGEPKYADVTKALEALKHSQDYIPQLKTENDSLKETLEQYKEKLSKAEALEEIVSKLSATPPANEQEQQETPPQAQGLDEQQLSATLEKLLNQRTAEETAAHNQKAVTSALTQKFGEKAHDAFLAKASEVGLSPDALEKLSAESPKAALSLFGIGAKEGSPSPTQGTVTAPHGAPPSKGITPPEKPLLLGAKTKDQIDYLLQIRKAVYEKHNITN